MIQESKLVHKTEIEHRIDKAHTFSPRPQTPIHTVDFFPQITPTNLDNAKMCQTVLLYPKQNTHIRSRVFANCTLFWAMLKWAGQAYYNPYMMWFFCKYRPIIWVTLGQAQTYAQA